MGRKTLKKSLSSAITNAQPSSSLMSMEEALAALIQRNEELLSLSQSKDEFIAITSHQLRTPDTGVKQYLGLLLEGYADPLTPSQQVFIEKAYENNERQLHIVDDILRIAQLDLDKIKLKPQICDMGVLVQIAIESLQGKFKSKNQKVKYTMPQKPVLAKVDTEEFRLVIENLLENASN
jgi:signal transduction histidine kinase